MICVLQIMSWSRQQIYQHITAARLLDHIRQEAFLFLHTHRRCTERETQQFILKQFKHFGLRCEVDRPIVAFRESTSHVHYYPPRLGSLRLRPQTIVLLDLWARLDVKGAPYADLTWMGWYGKKIPSANVAVFNLVCRARDAAMRFLRRILASGSVPTGRVVDGVARRIIAKAGYGKYFLHGLGHSLGTMGPHGNAGCLSPKYAKPLTPGMGYTIEPGVYLAGKYGARVEMDCFITQQKEYIITTELQREIVRI